ncbi:hypothetical protein [uncultured Adlercreutzia sp.]|uniref:hypothetical protein n=1 Tax=uncultured Adlercreutzia sp. TaxID=875803 RepID=UPI0026F3938B|nr:hypothetical protein [uncultured Adlercreutzia sp.]
MHINQLDSAAEARPLSRRLFVAAGAAALGGVFAAAGCAGSPAEAPEPAPSASEGAAGAEASPALTADTLPKPEPDPESPFGVDKNINMETIDEYLNIPGVAYRDARMLRDPAQYEEIGGHANLEMALEGFRIVPFPLVGTLQELPVSGAYTGERLFDVTWAADGTVAQAVPRFEESRQILEDLFPSDRPVMIMCGAGGYAGMTRQLLIALGWDPDLLYNVGGQWDYTGYHPVQLISYDADGTPHFMFWRADYADIDFDALTPIK